MHFDWMTAMMKLRAIFLCRELHLESGKFPGTKQWCQVLEEGNMMPGKQRHAKLQEMKDEPANLREEADKHGQEGL